MSEFGGKGSTAQADYAGTHQARILARLLLRPLIQDPKAAKLHRVTFVIRVNGGDRVSTKKG